MRVIGATAALTCSVVSLLCSFQFGFQFVSFPSCWSGLSYKSVTLRSWLNKFGHVCQTTVPFLWTGFLPLAFWRSLWFKRRFAWSGCLHEGVLMHKCDILWFSPSVVSYWCWCVRCIHVRWTNHDVIDDLGVKCRANRWWICPKGDFMVVFTRDNWQWLRRCVADPKAAGLLRFEVSTMRGAEWPSRIKRWDIDGGNSAPFVVVVVFEALSRFINCVTVVRVKYVPADGDTFHRSHHRHWNDATQSARWDGWSIVAGRDAVGFVLLLTEINDPTSIFTFYSPPLLSLTLPLFSLFTFPWRLTGNHCKQQYSVKTPPGCTSQS